MKPMTGLVICLMLSYSLGLCRGEDKALNVQRLTTLTSPIEVTAYRCQDLNQDHCNDLLVIGPQGQVKVWSGQCQDGIRLSRAGVDWSLPFPRQSLLALSSFDVDGNDVGLVTLTPDGLRVYPVQPNAAIDPNGILINRRMKCLFQLDQPVFSNFLQDINQDGRLDVLVPTMTSCEIWMNQGVSSSVPGNMPEFSRMGTFPVEITHNRSIDMNNETGMLSEFFSIPSLLLKDINGDKQMDLVVRHDPLYDYYLIPPGGSIPEHPTVSLDLTQFQDTTPAVQGVPLGEILSTSKSPRLIESDLNNDHIPDYVIFHRRKLWFFHGTQNGPQFTDPSSIIKIAEDITLLLICPLDEDDYPDLLMIKLQVPSITQLLGALFSDWDIKVESIGYRSQRGRSFALSSNWKGRIFLHLPSLLSVLNHLDQWSHIALNQNYGPVSHGDFNGDGRLDAAMVNTKNGRLEMWFGKADHSIQSDLKQNKQKELGAKIRKLAFSQSDNVWDIDRIKQGFNSLLNEQYFALTGGAQPDVSLTPSPDKTFLKALPVDFNHDGEDELLLVYADSNTRQPRSFELVTITHP